MRRYALLGLAQVAVGAAAIFARYALTGAGPIAVAASRMAVASLVLLLLAEVVRERERAAWTKRDVAILLAAGTALALHFASWIWSLEYTGVAVSTLLVGTTPIWTALYDAVVHRRFLSPLAWGAFALGAGGLVLVVGFNGVRPPQPGHALLGGALALLGAMAIAAYFLLVREVRGRYGTRPIVTATYTCAAVVLIAAGAAAHQPPPPVQNAAAWGGILAMALVSQLLGHTALNASLRWFSPSAVGFSTLLEPVSAALLAYAIFHEALTPAAIAGGFLVLAAIAVFLREERPATLPA